MNDFTKQELEQIINWATTDIDLHPSMLEVNLFDKIQSAIDNYDEYKAAGEKVMKKYDKAIDNLKDR